MHSKRNASSRTLVCFSVQWHRWLFFFFVFFFFLFFFFFCCYFFNIFFSFLTTATFFVRWAADPFTRGSYSYHAMNAGGAALRRDLAETISNVLFFAGEHTSERHSATVHGAYESGVREAEKVMKVHPIQQDEGRFIPQDVQDIVDIRNKKFVK